MPLLTVEVPGVGQHRGVVLELVQRRLHLLPLHGGHRHARGSGGLARPRGTVRARRAPARALPPPAANPSLAGRQRPIRSADRRRTRPGGRAILIGWFVRAGRGFALATVTPPSSPAERIGGVSWPRNLSGPEPPVPGVSVSPEPPAVFPAAGTAPDPPLSRPSLMAARGPGAAGAARWRRAAHEGGGREGRLGAASVVPRCRS